MEFARMAKYTYRTFYHFTSGRHLYGCINEGITLGIVPVLKDDRVVLLRGYQWITISSDFNQSWCEHSSLPYDRSEFRLTIKIPRIRQKNIIKWLDFCDDSQISRDLNSAGDPENWFLYNGIIYPQWIHASDKKSTRSEVSDEAKDKNRG